jgi:hypothetical protein
LGPDLQQKVGAALAPAHLLFFHKPFADHLLTADSANPVEMVFPCRYRSP